MFNFVSMALYWFNFVSMLHNLQIINQPILKGQGGCSHLKCIECTFHTYVGNIYSTIIIAKKPDGYKNWEQDSNNGNTLK